MSEFELTEDLITQLRSRSVTDILRDEHTATALQIVLSVGFFEAGTYVRTGPSWELIKPRYGYIRFTEHYDRGCDNEERTLYTYIVERGNEDALRQLAEIVDACNSDGYDDSEYELDLGASLPEHVVLILDAYTPCVGGMKVHMLSVGRLVIPENAMELVREGDDVLYNGSVRQWIGTSERNT
jgi:hypothetical protein